MTQSGQDWWLRVTPSAIAPSRAPVKLQPDALRDIGLD